MGANPLVRLVMLRRIEVLMQAMVLVLAVAVAGIPLEVVPMSAIIALLAAVNLLTQWRLDKGAPVSETKSSLHLAIDVGILGAAALLCRRLGQSLRLAVPAAAHAGRGDAAGRHAWAMAAITLLAYTFLIFWNLPLPPPQGDLAQFDALLARATGRPANTPRTAAALPCTFSACGSTS
jgi:two-component system sensor histidine kinase RegB